MEDAVMILLGLPPGTPLALSGAVESLPQSAKVLACSTCALTHSASLWVSSTQQPLQVTPPDAGFASHGHLLPSSSYVLQFEDVDAAKTWYGDMLDRGDPGPHTMYLYDKTQGMA